MLCCYVEHKSNKIHGAILNKISKSPSDETEDFRSIRIIFEEENIQWTKKIGKNYFRASIKKLQGMKILNWFFEPFQLYQSKMLHLNCRWFWLEYLKMLCTMFTISQILHSNK